MTTNSNDKNNTVDSVRYCVEWSGVEWSGRKCKGAYWRVEWKGVEEWGME
ncbi:hypothetical protein E2C01_085005 [Portunus trituberculatus]|uniref:Uncharacterized protein n=1 Tax=Portunus trituberculatus TaxID=210409 RepID=A0A5B7JAT5_PORTR|nr:hypothetical protein [Portunus trituberculatus]